MFKSDSKPLASGKIAIKKIEYSGTKYGLNSIKEFVFDVVTLPPFEETLKDVICPPQTHVARTWITSWESMYKYMGLKHKICITI